MDVYISSLIAGFLISLISMFVLLMAVKKRRYFIQPIRDRDSHKLPTPRIGGLAIVFTFFVLVIFWQLRDPNIFRFTNQTLLGMDINLFGLFAALLILTAVNVWDDFKNLPWWTKLSSQVLAALVIYKFGINVQWLTNPFGNHILLGGLSIIFVVLWLVTLSNATNWLDGMDGLAGGVSSISLFVIFLLSTSNLVNQPQNALLAIIALGALLGFLPFNLPPAKAFLGDTGSVFLGFLIGVLAIISGGKIATAFLVLAVPFLDAFAVIIQRLISKQSPFKADRRHLFHQLQNLGWKPWQVVGFFYTASAVFGGLALYAQSKGKFFAGLVALVLVTMFTIINVVYLSKRKVLANAK